MSQMNVKGDWTAEILQTAKLAFPLIIAQLAVMAINTTDVIMMGWLGPEFLAAGTLSTAVIHPILLAGVGILGVVTPLVAQGLGARKYKDIRRTTRQGLWVAALMSVISIPLLLQIESIILFLGQTQTSATLAEDYMNTAVWYLIPVFFFFVLRNLVSAHGNTAFILQITLVAIVVNAFGNYCLMFGNFGFPRLELRGAGISTTFVNTFLFLSLLVYVLLHPRYKRYYILVRIYKPDWTIFKKILKLGTPVGLMIASESGLFSAAAILMGWLGTAELAGHAVALQIAAIAFMVPLGLSYATTIRVGYTYGAGSVIGVKIAGWVSIAMGLGFMSITLLVFSIMPNVLVHLFLDPVLTENALAIGYAVSYLFIVALFQIADGGQVAAAAALRGINDTKVPMIVAIIGYWMIGLPTGYVLGFIFDMRGVGVWLGLAAGLTFVAIVLIYRFALLIRRMAVSL